MSQIITKKETAINSRGLLVTSYSAEIVGATDVNQLAVPSNATNIRRSISDGRATVTYDLADDGSSSSYSFSATASQEPLATHPMFKSGDWAVTAEEWKLWDKWQKDGTDLSQEDLTSKSEGFQKFIELTLKGITDYLQPRVVARVVQKENGTPSLARLGKISTFLGAPSLPGNGNWLLSGVEAQREDGSSFTVTREYMSSGDNGWEPDIYR